MARHVCVDVSRHHIRLDAMGCGGRGGFLERLLAVHPAPHSSSVDAGLGGYKARYHLGELRRRQGDAREAEAQWRTAVAERPRFLPAWLALGELYLEQGRWSAVEEVACQVETAGGSAEAAVLRSRVELGQGNFASARQRLERLIAAHPQTTGLRVLLDQALRGEGHDPGADPPRPRQQD